MLDVGLPDIDGLEVCRRIRATSALPVIFLTARIDVQVGTDDARDVGFRVVDDGPGIDPAEVHRVFERLFVSRAVPGRSVGTGLGLASVGELANAMGGSATVDQSSTGGAAFVVRLPVLDAPAGS